jgi:hypothetical protein
MIKTIAGMLGTGDLSTWGQSFVRSVAGQSNQGADTSNLSDKQVETVEVIFRKHFA